ncbi:sodium-dependent transporter [Nitrincola alkalilacustris]|uniref:sodium-dependent transporter n=1 Tax=Nitrincola alkalilacustris TaxID=1571224 RepID=UPI00124D3494|nr:sodium-dependent transporter [Nitrincola alkalilacustris]
MIKIRSEFASRFGFLMAAAGAAVGLGNVWGFPSMAANNGGGAFLLVYLVMSLVLAYPALMAELTLGRYAQSGVVNALAEAGGTGTRRRIGKTIGFYSVFIAAIGLTFYSIVTGWLISQTWQPVARVLELDSAYAWLTHSGIVRDLPSSILAIVLSAAVVIAGVNKGIERWSKRLMPMLVLMMLGLIMIIMTYPGALDGLKLYLIPDLTKITPKLMLDAMGQAFFSMSIGIGAMVIYGSYLNRSANLPITGAQVMFIDMGIAFIAGLLIIPAMFVAQNLGVNIYKASGELESSATLLFNVMPSMFGHMGGMGLFLEFLFFGLLSIAALTSMFPALEVPVSALEEAGVMQRRPATLVVAALILIVTTIIILNFDAIFGTVISFTINSMPLIGAMTCLFVGWMLSRNAKLEELRKGYPEIQHTLFWKIWPWYIRFVCPALPLIVLIRSLT